MENKNESCSNDNTCGCAAKKCPFCPGEMTLAFWLLRLWLGLRALVTGLEKFSVKKILSQDEGDFGSVVERSVNSYSFSAHQGVPKEMFEELGKFQLMPGWGLSIFNATLGYILIALGIMLLAGIGTRLSLFLQGLIYCSLTVGLIMLKQDAGIAWLAIHIGLIVAALVLMKHNKFAVLKNS